MKKILYSVVFVFSLSMFAFSQTPNATPPVENENDVVKISTNLIQIDVTVTDQKGKVISDIKPEEIEIYENGKKQGISNFSFISNVKNISEPVKTPPKEKVGVPIPPTALRPEQVQRTIALVVDDLTLSFESTYYVRRALKKFVDEQMQEGDLVAIIRTGAGIGALQQFTSDKRVLYAAIEKVRWNSVGSGGVGAFAPLQGLPPAETKEAKDQIKQMQDSENDVNNFRESVFATGTLGAINYIVRGMQNLPGRKSIMLLSDGFALSTKDANGFQETGRVLDSLRRLIDAANRAAVVINTMDARGLQVIGLTAADDTSGMSADQIGQAMGARSAKLADTQAGLQYLAQQTGGKAIVNNNDLSGEIRKMLDDQSYYLIGYQPDDETFDPIKRRFNNLQVKVTRKNVRVRYRSGFFGITDEKMTNRPATAQTPQQQILTALTSPFGANDISLHLNVLFGNDPKEGSYIKPLLHVDGKDLKFTDEPDGSKKAVFDVLAVIFGDNGLVIDQISKTYTFTPPPEVYKTILEKGFVYHLNFPVKKAGAYQFRVALRDNQSSKIGSASQFIEIPNLKKNNLTLSSIILDSTTPEALKSNSPEASNKGDVMSDASLRQFKKGSILRYGVDIYNTKPDQTKSAQLQTQIRVFRDGKPMFDGAPKPLSLDGQTNLQKISFAGALDLGTETESGEYVLQIIVIDNTAKESRKYATQWVQFEITE